MGHDCVPGGLPKSKSHKIQSVHLRLVMHGTVVYCWTQYSRVYSKIHLSDVTVDI